jgi:hypothetical protein
MSQQTSPALRETKQDRFIRLAERRVTRALQEMRLISQLSSINYENSEDEAEALVEALCGGVHRIADSFDTPFKTLIGAAVSDHKEASVFGAPSGSRTGTPVNQLDVIRALDHMKKEQFQEAYAILQAALREQKR